ncbi:hypothetical protein [Hyperthermus butylicus]|uniref:hypothetical protein n=1 Tax=Hyperthermus butylicus TaxID=54248 RepID=UPI00129AE68D|nr:hypothetical protein [Hyperthermus butylicus]
MAWRAWIARMSATTAAIMLTLTAGVVVAAAGCIPVATAYSEAAAMSRKAWWSVPVL